MNVCFHVLSQYCCCGRTNGHSYINCVNSDVHEIMDTYYYRAVV